MNLKTIKTIIPLVSVLIMFIWGWIEGSFEHSWIAVMVGGMLMGVLSTIDKNKKKESKDKESDK